MKIDTATNPMKPLFALAAKVKQPLPVLNHVRVRACSAGEMELAATDLEWYATQRLPAEASEPGALLLPAKTVSRLLPKLGGRLAIETGERGARLSDGDATFELPAPPAEEFPEPLEAAEPRWSAIDPAELLSAIGSVRYCASKDETRYNMCGVALEHDAESGALRVLATDGHRAAVQETEIPGDVVGKPGEILLLPNGSLAAVDWLLKGAQEAEIAVVASALGGQLCVLRTADSELRIRAVDAEYPNVRGVVRHADHFTLRVERMALIRALEKLSLVFSSRNQCAVGFEIDGQVRLQAQDPDGGRAELTLPCEPSSQEAELSIAFDVFYLTETLKALDSEELELGFVNEGSLMRILPAFRHGHCAYVMPMRR